MPGAGALDRRVTIQVMTEVPDATGHPVKTWTELTTVDARRQDVRGTERFQAQQTLAQQVAMFTIRWRRGLTPQHRLVEGGLVWNIQGIAERGRREWLEITAEAKVA